MAALVPCFRLGVVTNGFPDVQYKKLDRIGLRTSFLCVVVSGETEVAKPDARIFFESARRLDVTPGECVYVGDNYEHDVLGAQGAGMRACWFNPEGKPRPGRDAAPEWEAARLSQVAKALLGPLL